LTSVALLLVLASTLEEGELHYRHNRFEQARAVFANVLRSQSSSQRARLLLGYTELALGNNERAIQTLEVLEPKMARDEEFLFSLSEAYTREARSLATRVAGLGPSSARAHQLLAYRYQAEGNARMAEAEFRNAIEARPSATAVHSDLANYLWAQNRYDDAAAVLEEALRLQPLDFMANLRIGQYHLQRNRCERALEPLRIASRYRRFPEAFQLLAFATEKCADVATARSVVAAGLATFPNHAGLSEMHTRLGAAHRPWVAPPLSEPAVNVEKLRNRLKADASDEDAMFFLSQHYSNRGESLADALASIAPDSYRTAQLHALAAEYADDLPAAERLYRVVLAKQPKLQGAHYALGNILARLGRDQESEVYFRSELKNDPAHHLAHHQLGLAALKRGDLEAARDSLGRAVELNPEFLPARLELAKAMIQGGDALGAIPHLQRVIGREPEHGSAHFLLYRAFLSVGKQTEASRALAVHQQVLAKRNAVDKAGMR
jgi:superkiller protein 3